MVLTLIAVTLLVVAAAAVVVLRCAEVSREVDVVLRNTPHRRLHPSEWGPGAYVLPSPDVPYDVLPPSAAIVSPPTDSEEVGE